MSPSTAMPATPRIASPILRAMLNGANAAGANAASANAGKLGLLGSIAAGPRAFSTSSALLSTTPGNGAGSSAAAANGAAARRGILGLFPRRVTWGGALVIFALGFLDGAVSTEWYLSRSANKGQA